MRCSERARLSRPLLPPPPCHHHAAVAPAAPVAELGVVQRIVPSPANNQLMSLPRLATHPEFACRSLAACAASSGSLSALGFGRCATLSVLSNAFRGRIGLKPQAAQPCGRCHALPPSGHRRLRPRRPFHNSTRTPNHALQRTASRVTVAAIHVRSRLLRAGRCLTSAASFFASPSQLPRLAPQSLSLGSFGVSFRHPITIRL